MTMGVAAEPNAFGADAIAGLSKRPAAVSLFPSLLHYGCFGSLPSAVIVFAFFVSIALTSFLLQQAPLAAYRGTYTDSVSSRQFQHVEPPIRSCS